MIDDTTALLAALEHRFGPWDPCEPPSDVLREVRFHRPDDYRRLVELHPDPAELRRVVGRYVEWGHDET